MPFGRFFSRGLRPRTHVPRDSALVLFSPCTSCPALRGPAWGHPRSRFLGSQKGRVMVAVEMRVSSPEPAVKVFTPAGTCPGASGVTA